MRTAADTTSPYHEWASALESTAWWTLIACVAVLPLVTSLTLGALGTGAAFTDDPYNIPKLAVLVVLVSVSSLAWFGGILLGTQTLRLGPAFAWLGGFTLVAVVSTALAREPLSSLFGASGLSTGTTTWLTCAWMCFLLGQLASSGRRLLQVSWSVVAGCTAVAAVVLLQALGLDPLSTPVTPERAWIISRGAATLGNPDFTGLVLVLPSVVAVSLAFSARSRSMKAWTGICATVLSAAAFLTLTRAAWLGILVGLATLLFFNRSSSKAKNSRRLAVIAGVGAGIIAVGIVVARLDSVISRFSLARDGLDAFSSGRITLWGDAVRVIARNPLLGTGADRLSLGAYEVQTDVVTEGISRFVLQDPHNLVLLMAGIFGIPALILFVVFCGNVFVGAWRTVSASASSASTSSSSAAYAGWLAGTIGFLAASVLSVFTITAVFVLFLSLGVLLAPMLKPRTVPVWAVAVGLILFVGLGSVAAYGTRASVAASREVALSRVSDSRMHLERALILTPWDARTRVGYLWRKIGSMRPVLTGTNVQEARDTANALDSEIKLAILDFPDELLFYRMRIELYRIMEGSPGSQPDALASAVEDALSAFPTDIEFRQRQSELQE